MGDSARSLFGALGPVGPYSSRGARSYSVCSLGVYSGGASSWCAVMSLLIVVSVKCEFSRYSLSLPVSLGEVNMNNLAVRLSSVAENDGAGAVRDGHGRPLASWLMYSRLRCVVRIAKATRRRLPGGVEAI